VFKSNKFIYAQLIDDAAGKTIASVSTEGSKAKTPLLAAQEAGKTLAEMALKKNVSKVVFDRGGYIYTGKIKAIADGAREGGLNF
jgi:large subunit ribosomal protein L18